MSRPLLPIGISDFKELIEKKYYFVDKSPLIKQLFDDGAKVILIPRPRRFGKTLNLSMVHYFVNCATRENNAHLFKNLAIQQHTNCMAKQGTIPSIFLTLKGVKANSYQKCLSLIGPLLAELYDQYTYLLESDALSIYDKAFFKKILSLEADEASLCNALKMLTKFLHAAYGKKVMIFLDEYDVPIQAAYLTEDYQEVVNFMRIFMGEAFKDNIYLEKGVITGILRIAQASIFSDLNNIETYTLLRRGYAECFGFTQNEVDALLKEADLTEHSADIKDWYNGYQIDELKVYNPWSIIHCVKQEGKRQPYWVNTSNNVLIKDLLGRVKPTMKKVFEALLQGESVVQPVQEYIVMADLAYSEQAIWGLLLFSGYLTATSCELSERGLNCQLRIPNREVGFVYTQMIEQWFNAAQSLQSYDQLVKSVVSGDWDTFTHILQDYIRTSGSYFDFNANTPEAVYHALILGLVIGLKDDYIIQSNRETGYGRCDVAMIPKDPSKHNAMVLEFKRTEDENALTEIAELALEQISKNDYVAVFAQHSVKTVTAVGIGFAGRRVQVIVKQLTMDN